jgi:Xaa-Pro aminopeptidase
MQIEEVQLQLKQAGLDGWLLYDFQGINPIARKLLSLSGNMITRRWYFWVPKEGSPVVFCHKIEEQAFSSLGARGHSGSPWSIPPPVLFLTCPELMLARLK